MPYWLFRLLTFSGVVGFLVGALMVLDGEGMTRAAGVLVVLVALVALGCVAREMVTRFREYDWQNSGSKSRPKQRPDSFGDNA